MTLYILILFRTRFISSIFRIHKMKMCFIRVLNMPLYCVNLPSELTLMNVLGFLKVFPCCAEH